tara:strand:- start:156 stop:596 length:441 start_codon:yes stop_codon:yes gene_type:complete
MRLFYTFIFILFATQSFAERGINSPSLADHGKWMKMGSNTKTGDQYYYGLKTKVDPITEHNYTWFMTNLRSTEMSYEAGFFKSFKSLFKIDCPGSRYQLLGTSYHNYPMAGGYGRVIDHNNKLEWENIGTGLPSKMIELKCRWHSQ